MASTLANAAGGWDRLGGRAASLRLLSCALGNVDIIQDHLPSRIAKLRDCFRASGHKVVPTFPLGHTGDNTHWCAGWLDGDVALGSEHHDPSFLRRTPEP